MKAAMSALPETLGLAGVSSTESPKRIRRVTIEAERTMIFRTRSSHATLWCPRCQAEVEMLSVEAAARHLATTELEIHQLVEFDTLHFGGDATGRMFVCLNSLNQIPN